MKTPDHCTFAATTKEIVTGYDSHGNSWSNQATITHVCAETIRGHNTSHVCNRCGYHWHTPEQVAVGHLSERTIRLAMDELANQPVTPDMYQDSPAMREALEVQDVPGTPEGGNR